MSTETIADIVAELDLYERAGERPGKEYVWALGARIGRAASAAPCERCAAIGKTAPAAGSVADFNGTRRRVCDACHDAHVAALVLAERERCAKIAEAPREPTRGGGPADPQRIAAAIRALK